MKLINQLKRHIAISVALCFFSATANATCLPVLKQDASTVKNASMTVMASNSVVKTMATVGVVKATSAKAKWKLVYSGGWFVCFVQLMLLKGPNHDSSAYMKKNGKYWEVWSQNWTG